MPSDRDLSFISLAQHDEADPQRRGAARCEPCDSFADDIEFDNVRSRRQVRGGGVKRNHDGKTVIRLDGRGKRDPRVFVPVHVSARRKYVPGKKERILFRIAAPPDAPTVAEYEGNCDDFSFAYGKAFYVGLYFGGVFASACGDVSYVPQRLSECEYSAEEERRGCDHERHATTSAAAACDGIPCNGA